MLKFQNVKPDKSHLCVLISFSIQRILFILLKETSFVTCNNSCALNPFLSRYATDRLCLPGKYSAGLSPLYMYPFPLIRMTYKMFCKQLMFQHYSYRKHRMICGAITVVLKTLIIEIKRSSVQKCPF